MEKSYVDKLDARKPLDYYSLRISPEFFRPNIFLPLLSLTVSQYSITWILIKVRQDVIRINNSVVVTELELSINGDLNRISRRLCNQHK